MQHPVLRATVLSIFAGFGLCNPAYAGQNHGQGFYAGHLGQGVQMRPHRPVYRGVASGGYAPDAPRILSPQTETTARALTVPLPAQQPLRQTLGIDSETVTRPYPHHYHAYNGRRPLEMLSGNPVDPHSVLSELPSGRIVMQSPSQRYGYRHHRGYNDRVPTRSPYSPPSFQIIGEPSARHMGTAVKLTYGTPVQKRLNPSPRVIWIKAETGNRDIQVIK